METYEGKKQKYKIAFIIPWVGKLPVYFDLWLRTCRYNPDVDFLLFTDDTTEHNYPRNVKVYYTNLSELGQHFQEHYSFNVSLNQGYKLCDYRPAYGELFAEYLDGYDFWGHCDIDLIWGNIRHFVTDDILGHYDRVYTQGHCCLYRNNAVNNAMYRTLKTEKYQKWENVFMSPKSCCFDEWGGHVGGGISFIYQENGIDCYNEFDFADIGFGTGYFDVKERKDAIGRKDLYFKWNEGKLFLCSAVPAFEHEILYAHFQKRKLRIECGDSKMFYFVAPNIVTDDTASVKRHLGAEVKYYLSYQKKRFARKIKVFYSR